MSMAQMQEAEFGEGFDYIAGSPHLKHPRLNQWMRDRLNHLVNELAEQCGRAPRVLEVGAGHGTFTDTLVGAGGQVVVTEMSPPSADTLARRFRHSPSVQVRHDPDGDVAGAGEFDLVVYISVLHHIPDYLASLEKASGVLLPGGALVAFQDPTLYARRSPASLLAANALYGAWRVTRGDLRRGVIDRIRRARGHYDASQVSDMSEYHVVRDGVDEQAIEGLLAERFTGLEIPRYWSTQSTWGQAVGERLLPPNTFGVVATGRRAGAAPSAHPGTRKALTRQDRVERATGIEPA